MDYIRNITRSPAWPFDGPSPEEYPQGLILGLSFVYPYTEGQITLLQVKDDYLTINLQLLKNGSMVNVMWNAPLSKGPESYNILNTEGKYVGHITVDGTEKYNLDISGTYPLLSSVFLPGVPGEDVSYSFTGDNGVNIQLIENTNEVIFRTDKDIYSTPLSDIAESTLRSDLDEGISTIGNLSRENINLVIEGLKLDPEAEYSGPIIKFRYLLDEDLNIPYWPGCEESTVFKDSIHCSRKDGSNSPYPLDDFFCSDDDPVCNYIWEIYDEPSP